MKVLVVADWHGGEIYADVLLKRFKELGCDVHKFSWKEYFHHYQYADRYETDGSKVKSFYYRFQNKFTFGPVVNKINKNFLSKVSEIKPDLVFIYRGTHIYPKSIEKIKEKNDLLVFGYNNDDPFSDLYPKYFWRHFLNGVQYYDHIFSYRQKNIDDYLKIGYEKTSLLRSYYNRELNFLENPVSTRCIDVVFIGHFEDDGRDQDLLELSKLSYNVKLYGTGWEKSSLYSELAIAYGEIKPIYKEYNSILNKSKIALVYLSKLNSDTYTRRCFEIPAAGALMLSERTNDLTDLFVPNEEAVYFENTSELLELIHTYLEDDIKRIKVATAGNYRVIKDGHEASDRVLEILNKASSGMREKMCI